MKGWSSGYRRILILALDTRWSIDKLFLIEKAKKYNRDR